MGQKGPAKGMQCLLNLFAKKRKGKGAQLRKRELSTTNTEDTKGGEGRNGGTLTEGTTLFPKRKRIYFLLPR